MTKRILPTAEELIDEPTGGGLEQPGAILGGRQPLPTAEEDVVPFGGEGAGPARNTQPDEGTSVPAQQRRRDVDTLPAPPAPHRAPLHNARPPLPTGEPTEDNPMDSGEGDEFPQLRPGERPSLWASSRIIWIFVGVFLLGVLGGVAYVLWQNASSTDQPQPTLVRPRTR